jgi:transposase
MSGLCGRCRRSAQLDGLLLANLGKAPRERLTLVRIFEELRGLGCEGSYDAVRRYAKAWKREHGAAEAQAYVPLSFSPAEAYQFDWSHEIVLINSVTSIVKVAHFRLCHSRMPFVRAYRRESQEMVFDAHERAFAFFRGACSRGIYDNMKTAVETVFLGKDRQLHDCNITWRRLLAEGVRDASIGFDRYGGILSFLACFICLKLKIVLNLVVQFLQIPHLPTGQC